MNKENLEISDAQIEAVLDELKTSMKSPVSTTGATEIDSFKSWFCEHWVDVRKQLQEYADSKETGKVLRKFLKLIIKVGNFVHSIIC